MLSLADSCYVTASPGPGSGPGPAAYSISKQVHGRACAHKHTRVQMGAQTSSQQGRLGASCLVRLGSPPPQWGHSVSQAWPFLLGFREQVFLSLLSLLLFTISSCLFLPLLALQAYPLVSFVYLLSRSCLLPGRQACLISHLVLFHPTVSSPRGPCLLFEGFGEGLKCYIDACGSIIISHQGLMVTTGALLE